MLRSARGFAGGAMLVLAATPVSAQAPGRTVVLHQDFAFHHPHYPYVVINDLTMVEGLRAKFPDLHRHTPVLTASR